MSNYKSGSTTVIQIVCAIIFVIFSIYYICSFQGDILGMMQYAWSDHETHYNRFIGGSIIVFLMILMTYLVSLSCSLPSRVKTLVYLPAMLTMGQITAVSVDPVGHVYMSWYPAWITILLLILFPFFIKWINKIHTSSILPLDAEHAMQWLTNGGILLLLIVTTYSIGNTDRNLHTTLAVERLCHQQKYAETLDEGYPQYDHGSNITMWRALALAHQERKDSVFSTMLGERLFTYNIDGKNRTLLPLCGTEPHALLYDCYPVWQTIGFVPRNINEDATAYLKRELRHHNTRPAAKDYLLCIYLLRKDLRSFVHELPLYYDINESLPKHYKEALTLYYSNPIMVHSLGVKDSVKLDSAMIEDFHDFQDMLHIPCNNTVKNANLRDNFFGTYWYYYYRKD